MSRQARRNYERFGFEDGWRSHYLTLPEINAENEEEQKLRDELNKPVHDYEDRINPHTAISDEKTNSYFDSLNRAINNMNLLGDWDDTPQTKKAKKSVTEGKITLLQFDSDDSSALDQIRAIMGNSVIGSAMIDSVKEIESCPECDDDDSHPTVGKAVPIDTMDNSEHELSTDIQTLPAETSQPMPKTVFHLDDSDDSDINDFDSGDLAINKASSLMDDDDGGEDDEEL